MIRITSECRLARSCETGLYWLFSKNVTLIDNYQRSTMSRQRFNDLAIFCIENQISAELYYEDNVKAFSEQKKKTEAC